MLGLPQVKGREPDLARGNRKGRSWPQGLPWGGHLWGWGPSRARGGGGRFWGALLRGQAWEKSTRVAPRKACSTRIPSRARGWGTGVILRCPPAPGGPVPGSPGAGAGGHARGGWGGGSAPGGKGPGNGPGRQSRGSPREKTAPGGRRIRRPAPGAPRRMGPGRAPGQRARRGAVRQAPRGTGTHRARASRGPAPRPRRAAPLRGHGRRHRCLPRRAAPPRRPRSAGLSPALKLATEASLPSPKMAAAAASGRVTWPSGR